ncbi:peptide deformylase [Mucilaginibacter sp. RB4R14]|uniref:peptide deformylase n=1 Tax=Mucilaginibacter aurantiaciroseus TaxID=2949308 RepID=UPI002091E243|nr:peptide deformylase [Mucilaginibacter aurantiaciroseus]MCO5936728.1 peptide deformylase [Mucilaginibacter aurantiaciroseus]
MKYPIIAYGDPVLRKKATSIEPDEYPNIKELVGNMFDTMYGARGVGLAAPQVGMSMRLFVVDVTPFDDEEPALKDFKKVFINATILEETGEEWSFNEGCLSIPDIREDVRRKPSIKISYYDENWKHHEETITGMAARVIQHEYDHIEGKLFTDKLSPLRKRLIEKRLNDISKGSVDVDYRMKFPAAKKGR